MSRSVDGPPRLASSEVLEDQVSDTPRAQFLCHEPGAEGTMPSTGALQCIRDKKEAVMKKILGLALVAMLSLTLAAPVSAGGGPGGGFHGGSHGGFHHDGFHRFGCCFGPAFVGGVFVGSALAYPYYADPYYAYPYATYPAYADPGYAPAPAYQPQPQVSVAPPPIQPEVCYLGGCYHLQGDGVTVAYSWVWVPAAPSAPPAPPSR